MNIYPDQKEFEKELNKAASQKRLSVFEYEGSYFVMDETNGYVTDPYTLSGAASFVNRFNSEKIRSSL